MFHAMSDGGFNQRAGNAGVVAIVAERISDRFRHNDRTGKMNDRLYVAVSEQRVRESLIAEFAPDQPRLRRDRPFKPVESRSATRTLSPASTSLHTMWLPMYPAPPVTKIVICCLPAAPF